MVRTSRYKIFLLCILLIAAFILPGCGKESADLHQNEIADINITSDEQFEIQKPETDEPVEYIRVLGSVRIQASAEYDPKNEDRECVLEYDNQGRLYRVDSEIYSYWEKSIYPQFIYDTIIPGIDQYEYDDSGRISKVTRKSEDGKEKFSVDYDYDPDGKLMLETYKNGTDVLTDTYEYNEEGLLSSVKRDLGHRIVTITADYRSNGSLSGLEYDEPVDYLDYDKNSRIEYDSEERFAAIELSSKGTFDESAYYVFKYNNRGELTEVKFAQGYFDTKYILSYKYEEIPVTA